MQVAIIMPCEIQASTFTVKHSDFFVKCSIIVSCFIRKTLFCSSFGEARCDKIFRRWRNRLTLATQTYQMQHIVVTVFTCDPSRTSGPAIVQQRHVFYSTAKVTSCRVANAHLLLHQSPKKCRGAGMSVVQLCGSQKLSAITRTSSCEKRGQISTYNNLPDLNKCNDTFFTRCRNFQPKGALSTTIFGTMFRLIEDLDFIRQARPLVIFHHTQ